MNILFLSTWFPYQPDNGAKIRAHYLLRALHEQHRVTVAAFCPPHDAERARQAAESAPMVVRPIYEDPFRHTAASKWIKFASPIPIIYWRSHAMQQIVAELAELETWDAIVAIQTPVASYVRGFTAIPKVLDVDTALCFQMRERNALRGSVRTWLSWQKAHWYEQRLFRQFQACTVVSSHELPYLQSLLKGTPATSAVVPNGVDCLHHRPGLFARRPNTLVYNGALTYSANYDAMQYFLSEVYPFIRQQAPEVTLTITGSTEGVDRSGLPLDESVVLSGYVDDIRSVVGSCAVCVVPLRWGGGTRLKILEAMALGAPVISTSKGAEGLDVRHGEHLLLADNAQSFAQYTLRLLRDPALGQRLSAQARQLMEQRYDWSSIGQQFVRLIENVA